MNVADESLMKRLSTGRAVDGQKTNLSRDKP